MYEMAGKACFRKGCVMASSNRGYWSRSWELLTRDEGWIKPLLVLGAARLIPIVGYFGVDGYALEWARLTSWGIDSSPKQKGVDISACIKTGAKAFVVSLGYVVALLVLQGIIASVFNGSLGGLLEMALSLLATGVIVVAKLRATIYQTIGAGYEIPRIIDMIKRDYKGLLRIVGLQLVIGLVICLVISLFASIALVMNMGAFVSLINESYYDDLEIVRATLSWMGQIMPALFVLAYFASILYSFSNLIVTTATGLWMRQFDVQNWGESSDPLPTTAPGTPAAGPAYNSVPTNDVKPAAYSVPEQYVPEQRSDQPSTANTYQPSTPMGEVYEDDVPVEDSVDTVEVERMPLVTPMPDFSAAQSPAEQDDDEEETVQTFQLSGSSPLPADESVVPEPSASTIAEEPAAEPAEPEYDDEVVETFDLMPRAHEVEEDPVVEPAAEPAEPEEPEYDEVVETFDLMPHAHEVEEKPKAEPAGEPVVEKIDLMEEAERLFDLEVKPTTKIISDLEVLLDGDVQEPDEVSGPTGEDDSAEEDDPTVEDSPEE